MQILFLISKGTAILFTAITAIRGALPHLLKKMSVDDKKRESIAFWANLIYIFLLVALTVNFFYMMDYYKVPNVVGLSKDEAVTVLYASNLNATYSLEMDGEAIIVSQNPEKGEIVKEGMPVKLETETGNNEFNSANKSFIQEDTIISFGSYEQDGLISNGSERIEWIVLEVREDKALLLSLYALDSQPYNDIYEITNWQDCTLRLWLNDSFLKTAFTAEERELIRLTEVDNGKSQNNKDWNVTGCKNTDDMIFLLSYADTDRYFDNQAARICTPTDYAITMGADVRTLDDGVTDAAWWWLRSPGETSSHASFVNFDGTRYTNAVGNEYLSVRPALWIDMDKYLSYIDSKQ